MRAAYRSEPMVGGEPASAMIIGLGNLLLGDEGIGVHAMRQLEADYRFEPAVRLVDGGTSGLDLLPLLKDQQRLLMIDALVSNQPPGSIHVIRNGAIKTALTEKVSLHHLGLADLLALAELLDDIPPEIVLIGIVPERTEMELRLSGCLRERLPDLIATTCAVLAEWGIDARPHPEPTLGSGCGTPSGDWVKSPCYL